MGEIAYLSLGSNMGDRHQHLRDAITGLDSRGSVTSVSSFYETEPVDVLDQAWFLNCAVALETSEAAPLLMTHILQLEERMGRRRTRSKGPRTIDVDILLYGDAIIELPELTIPHPALARRRFVLEPLAEIAPQVLHPILKKTIQELLEELPPGQIVRKIEER